MNTNIYGDFQICIGVPLRFRILRNQGIVRKSLKFMNLMASTQSATHKANFGIMQENCKNSAVKHSIERSILFREFVYNILPKIVDEAMQVICR